jgi:hypothetical protein
LGGIKNGDAGARCVLFLTGSVRLLRGEMEGQHTHRSDSGRYVSCPCAKQAGVFPAGASPAQLRRSSRLVASVKVSRDDFGGHGFGGAGSAGKQDFQAARDSARLTPDSSSC